VRRNKARTDLGFSPFIEDEFFSGQYRNKKHLFVCKEEMKQTPDVSNSC